MRQKLLRNMRMNELHVDIFFEEFVLKTGQKKGN